MLLIFKISYNNLCFKYKYKLQSG